MVEVTGILGYQKPHRPLFLRLVVTGFVGDVAAQMPRYTGQPKSYHLLGLQLTRVGPMSAVVCWYSGTVALRRTSGPV
jgi:hypothetical protein